MAAYPAGRLWPEVENLVRSVHRNAPGSRVLLVTGDLSREEARILGKYGAGAVPLLGAIPQFRQGDEASQAERQAWILELFGRRYAAYAEALEGLPEHRVLLSDVRDVLMTNDIPSTLAQDRIVFSQEQQSNSLANEPWNRKWLIGAYGQLGLDQVGGAPILCAGCTLGPKSAMSRYIETMREEVSRLGVETIRRVGDQPLHNYLAHTGRLGEFQVSRAEDGPIRSIGVLPTDSVRLDWLHGDESAPAVIHQYDRHMHVRKFRHLVARVTGIGLGGLYCRAVVRRLAHLGQPRRR